jgi:hypothetical protein
MTEFPIPKDTALKIAKAIGVDIKAVETANQLRLHPVQDEDGGTEITVTAGPGSASLSYQALIDGKVSEVEVAYNFDIEQGGLLGPIPIKTPAQSRERNISLIDVQVRDPWGAGAQPDGPHPQ